jgi:hypothetical protein
MTFEVGKTNVILGKNGVSFEEGKRDMGST